MKEQTSGRLKTTMMLKNINQGEKEDRSSREER
jgi:hypothetical protein